MVVMLGLWRCKMNRYLETLIILNIRLCGSRDALSLKTVFEEAGYKSEDIDSAIRRILDRGDLRLGRSLKLEYVHA